VFITLSCSFEPISVKEYYEDGNTIKVEQIFHSKDKSNYEITFYYMNGQIKSKGSVKNSKEEGIWEYWYADGVKKCSVPYTEGKIDHEPKDRKKLYLIFEHDSLKIGVPTKLKIIGLYPGEAIYASANIDLGNEEYEDYDCIIVPMEGDSATFGYQKLHTINLSKVCMENISNSLAISGKEMENSSLYSVSVKEIETVPIFK
jgi:hypothetical protein